MRAIGYLALLIIASLTSTDASEARTWNWSWISSYADSKVKSSFWTEEGLAADASTDSNFDIRIGGKSRLTYQLKGIIKGKRVTAVLTDLDADEIPMTYDGYAISKAGKESISLSGPDGSAILLYTRANDANSGLTAIQ